MTKNEENLSSSSNESSDIVLNVKSNSQNAVNQGSSPRNCESSSGICQSSVNMKKIDQMPDIDLNDQIESPEKINGL